MAVKLPAPVRAGAGDPSTVILALDARIHLAIALP